ncbi:MAG: aspartyl protease family protein [Sphingomonadaceae bacterium]|nr:aspartyl protease family protein [Sphingomonadaceae bacterium]
MTKTILRAALFGALSVPALAQAAPLPSTPAIVASWRHATHQEARAEARTAHLHYSLAQEGLTGTFDTWVTPSGLYREATDRGQDDGARLLTAHGATRRDWNNYVRRLEGAEAMRLRTAAATARILAFGPPDAMARATVGESPDHRAWTLAYTAPGAGRVTWYLDRASGLPLRSVTTGEDDDAVTTSYADWQPGPGGLTPRRIAVTADRGTDTLTLAAAPVYARTRAADFAPLTPGPSDTRMGSDSVDVPFTMAANHIILPVSVNGRPPIGFLFDTGAGDELVNTARLAELGIAAYGATQLGGGGGVQASAYARDVDLAIGGATLSRQHARVVDLSGLEHIFGIRLGGILGYDFIGRFVLEIDYGTKVMRLNRPENFAYRGGVPPIPITIEDGIPYAEGVIAVPTRPHIPVHFAIDFGAADTMILTRPFVEANDLLNLAGTDRNVTRTPGPQQMYTQNNRRGRLDEWHLGPAVQRNVPVSFSANTSGAYASPAFAGTVGEGIYTRYHVFIDYGRRTLILEPTATTNDPFRQRPPYGLVILASDDLSAVTVSAVAVSSPAAAQGFQPGDVIAGVDGRPVSVEDVRAVLAAGGQHVFVVTRGGRSTRISADIPAPR